MPPTRYAAGHGRAAFDRVAIRVADLGAAERFYATTLGALGLEPPNAPSTWRGGHVEHFGVGVPELEPAVAFWAATMRELQLPAARPSPPTPPPSSTRTANRVESVPRGEGAIRPA